MSNSKYPTGSQRIDDMLAEYLRALEEGSASTEDILIARNPELAGRLRDFFAEMRSRENWENEGGALRTGFPIIE